MWIALDSRLENLAARARVNHLVPPETYIQDIPLPCVYWSIKRFCEHLEHLGLLSTPNTTHVQDGPTNHLPG